MLQSNLGFKLISCLDQENDMGNKKYKFYQGFIEGKIMNAFSACVLIMNFYGKHKNHTLSNVLDPDYEPV